MNRIKLIIIFILAIVVSACGYKLAGKADLDTVFEKTHVAYQGQGYAMAELVELQLEVNENQLVDAKDATAIVNILYERTEREILAVDEEGKVREFELILQIGFNVVDSSGERMMKNQDIRLSRDFLFDINDVIGGSREERLIYQEMREDAARLIIYRLQAISSEPIET